MTSERSKRVDDALAPDQGFRLEGDAMSAGELHAQGRKRFVVGRVLAFSRGGRAHGRLDGAHSFDRVRGKSQSRMEVVEGVP